MQFERVKCHGSNDTHALHALTAKVTALEKRISSGHNTAYFQRTDFTDTELILDLEPTLKIPSWSNMTLRFKRFGTRQENSGARGTTSTRNLLHSGMLNI